MKRTMVLTVLDGWGIGASDASNPIYAAEPQTVLRMEREFQAGAIQASGVAVGLPWEEEGNSEVGHLTLGAGRTLLQYFPRISAAINNGSFFTNPALTSVMAGPRKRIGELHLLGLLSSGNVHASFPHIEALMDLAQRSGVTRYYLHLLLDGRDSPPTSGVHLLESLQHALDARGGGGVIASLAGRYWGMDRDQHWERTERYYRNLTGAGGETVPNAQQFLERAYASGTTDEYLPPVAVGEPHPLQSGDALICWNFREDRMRQLLHALVDPSFRSFPRAPIEHLAVATMTDYEPGLPVAVAYTREHLRDTLGGVLADHGKLQVRIAETEKYAHVTYFFNGLAREPFPGEYRILIPSRRVARHDEAPEMAATAITDRALLALAEGSYDFMLVNYANADMVAHTGNFDATVAAVRTVDRELARLLDAVLAGNHELIVTADHGNAEVLIDPTTGATETGHNASPVPCYLVAPEFRHAPRTDLPRLETIGMLSDIAPTVLELMGLTKPLAMTGTSLLPALSRPRDH